MHAPDDNKSPSITEEDDEDLFKFQPEETSSLISSLPPWSVLTVDDDRDFQRTTAFALDGIKIFNRPIELTQAFSMAEASTLLATQQRFGVVLLDVVMETDYAGLRLVKAIREVLGNAEIRIVLITGQPGMAPMRDVMSDYDINEYCTKSELTTSRLIAILTSELRTFDQLKTISTARRGLQLIVESSNRLLNKHDLTSYCDAALTEIALLLGLNPEGVICARADQIYQQPDDHKIIIVGAAGKLRNLIGKSIRELPDNKIVNGLLKAIHARNNIEQDQASILFFPKEMSGADFVIYLPTERTLLDTERQLLQVFASNISGGLHNVALFSRLDQLAYSDNLLRIPNKNALIRAIDRALLTEQRPRLLLLIVDLDDFARINHTFGLAYGDALLRQFSHRLCETLAAPTLVSRLGDDVFGILGSYEHVSASLVKSALDRPFEINGISHLMTACITSVYLDSVEGNARDAIRQGLLALKEAKRQGPGNSMVYDKNLENSAIKCFQILHDLQQALTDQQLFLAYQPKIDLSSGEIAGVEALIRWNKEGRAIPPSDFIPIAEASTLIHSIGIVVLTEVCKAIITLQQIGLTPPTFCINVSGKQFSDTALIPSILDILCKHNISPNHIELEVTETAMMESFDRVSMALREFRKTGGHVAIDDFGTGYSSLKYLNELPADTLKIDRSFVAQIESSHDHGSIASMVIKLARNLDMQVIAEGVENETQDRWLRDNHCDLGQGWLYGRPMTLDVLIDWLQERSLQTMQHSQS
ncbi:bifunctional diguanylate cyclase/phosphodiesterase [Methylomarinum vadi]|uniref:bifunctional diguanylate cyclase/phosphodiesterase n=1 Tax=Methylomarinum vadi TaxID=438855 RepID=UPI00056D1B58|nr:EAL domain-containing protein [Methylomarinum vadi]